MGIHLACGCPVPPGGGGGDDTIARELEEADIVKIQDGYLYVANPFTGLRIIDARNMDEPRIMGRATLGGRGVELFVRDDLAFVMTSSDIETCLGVAVGTDADEITAQLNPDYDGSRIWVVDVSDKMNPTVVNSFDLNGFITALRRLGDVIYATGNFLKSSERSSGEGQGVFVTSINIANPDNIFTVETVEAPGEALDVHIGDNVMYIFGDDPDMAETTHVDTVEISDPGGDIIITDQFRVPGHVDNRFFVDEHEGMFRIITDEFNSDTFVNVVALYVYDVSDLRDIRRISRLPIISNESLRSVRFDGNRGYAVTFVVIDPLFVMDLSDPSNPQLTGELEVPGFSTHLVPLGDRLVGVGFDNTGGVRPAVALYDVADPANPRQLSRITVGERFGFQTTSSATVDGRALKVIESANLILLPVSTFDFDTGIYTDSLQLIEMSASRLDERGVVDHIGFVRRADILEDRVWVLSDQAFQTINIDDLEAPASLAELEFISEQELLDAGLSECAQDAREEGTRVNFFIPSTGCGAFGFILFILMPMGLTTLRWYSRRLRETTRHGRT